VTPFRAGRTAVAALLLAVSVAGCSDPDTSPIPNTLPSPDASSSADRSLPPATGKWTALAAKCPDLASAAARTLGVAGAGRPTADYATNGPDVTADCRWGSDDGQGVSVTMRMTIYQAQAAADAAWQVLSAGQTEKLAGVGDEAFTSLEQTGVAIRVRSNNAVTTVRIVAPAGAASPDRLRELRQSAGEITADVLDDLR
jgi:hypothetical protein